MHQIKFGLTPHACQTDQDYEMLGIGIIRSPFSPVFPHFQESLLNFFGVVTFNTHKQHYEFINCPGAEMDASFVTYHENHN